MKYGFAIVAFLGSVNSASAADMSLGISLGGVADLPDPVSQDHTRFNVGPSFGLQYRVGLTQYVRLRAGLHSYLATGQDRITWNMTVDGQDVRLYDDNHWSMAVGLGLTAGFDVVVPGDLPVSPYIGGEFGGAWIANYHSLGGDTQVLLDPSQNDLDDPGNVDPYTTQVTWLTDLHLGVEKSFGDSIFANIEVGYQLSYVGAQPLNKAPEQYDSRREAYGWNAIRFGLGIGFML